MTKNDEKLTHTDPDAHATAEQLARGQVIKQIERRPVGWPYDPSAAPICLRLAQESLRS